MVTQQRLKELLIYNKNTGIFTRRVTKAYNAVAGSIAGTKNDAGYLLIAIDGRQYRAHRLAWLYEYGEFPSLCIDHINHIPDDNRIANLRVVSKKDNNRNQRISKLNNSGICGVTWNNRDKGWYAQICVEHKTKPLGFFKVKEEAINARKNAEVLYGFHENHGKREVV